MTASRKIVSFKVNKKTVTYFDEIWENGIQILPKDSKVMLKLMQSRKKDIKVIAALILDANKGKNLKEYNACKTEQELIEVVSRECLEKGLLKI